MSDLQILKEMKVKAEDMKKGGWSDNDIGDKLRDMDHQGYDLGEYGYPTAFYRGDYLYILNGKIYKEINDE